MAWMGKPFAGQMKNSDFFSGLFFSLVSMASCILAVQLGLGKIQKPGSGLIPFGTAALLSLMSIGMVFRSLLTAKKKEEPQKKVFQSTRWKTLTLVIGALTGYGVFLNFLGFTVITFLLMTFLLRVISKQPWWRTLVTSMLIVLGAYFIFVFWLDCPFPKGIVGI